ncbi:uncharacterized protein LOC121726277 [Aricia agestis]|uniref:uncharacterized protein LOC121726277 n=1 Tax=Aricia agestis TaxID=91739 RepID=UPI001C208E45|nr:uncharacterized protein LOC121726277 [Aricia agestis]
MYQEGCLCESPTIENLKTTTDSLNFEVVDRVSGSQELVMLNDFTHEINDYNLRKTIEQRVSDVSSWCWVLEDLVKRLEDSLDALDHERNAVEVVTKRLEDEVQQLSLKATRPGALAPIVDCVEKAIKQEHDFLRDQKKEFEQILLEVDKEIAKVKRCKSKISKDALEKKQALAIDKMCAEKDYSDAVVEEWKKKKKREYPLRRWLSRCASVKRVGLKCLCSALITRQQIRGARLQLSIAAQMYAARVDAALRRRLHQNQIKLQDLSWRKDEAQKDYETLDAELVASESRLLQTLDMERVANARIADRFNRPSQERILDKVDSKLRDERRQLQLYTKELRSNIKRILSLQDSLKGTIMDISCVEEDLLHVVKLDEYRIEARQTTYNVDAKPNEVSTRQMYFTLPVIQEEDDYDYPFDE